MVINRAGALAGPLAIVGGSFVLWLPGIPVFAQRPAVAGASSVHSIKISLAPSAPGGADCQLGDPLPQTAGVYKSDTVRFNVENGCETEATISISNFTLEPPAKGTIRLFDTAATWPRDIAVAPLSREHADAPVLGGSWEGEEDRYIFHYTISLKSPGAGGTKKPGRIVMCRRPPCF